MRKLLLTSNGFSEDINIEFFKLIGKKPSQIKIGFIPTASDVEDNKSYVQEDLDTIDELGISYAIIDLKNETKKSLYDKLSKVDVIMIEGGNTFYLLDWVRKSRFDKIIEKLLDEGKVYFGISAGSYIACPTIEAASWKGADRNIVNITDLTGLNLVPFILSAHYNREKYYKAMNDGASKIKLPVIALTDGQAIIVEDDYYRIIGDGERNYFNGFKERKK